jgi:hypothetical protein
VAVRRACLLALQFLWRRKLRSVGGGGAARSSAAAPLAAITQRIVAQRNALAAVLRAAHVVGWANSYRLGVNLDTPALARVLATPWGRANNVLLLAIMHQVRSPSS